MAVFPVAEAREINGMTLSPFRGGRGRFEAGLIDR
jgi:hypothetical protein